ncbi:sulfatase-like hydrolase/transferase [Lentisphaerota bacterium WC36G]|nr:sulfatase-like hydrolase/transferase [Lentisphaerae bacterium WC36]
MTDSQRFDMLGCYGNEKMSTPNLDAMAENGVRFDRAYCCQGVCEPARSALFTGTFPHTNGGWTNSIGIADNIKSIGERLTDNGIHCGYIGKWHLDGGDYFGLGIAPKGWDKDIWYDMRNYLKELTPEQRLKSRKSATNNEGVSEDFTFGHRCASRALEFIEKNKNNDFFLVVSFDEPHDPFLCPDPYASMYKGFKWQNPNQVVTEDQPYHQQLWHEANYNISETDLEFFMGCNSYIDYEIGRVLNCINEKLPDAMTLYTSDHGDALGEHGLGLKGPAAYDGITRIPIIVQYKDIPKGSVNTGVASHIDIVPTILEFFDAPNSKVLEGKSMMKSLFDPNYHNNEQIFIEFGRYEVDHDGFGGFQPMRCVFDGRYKLVVNLLSDDELYDLENDKLELVNLINSDDVELCKKRDNLHDILLNWMNETRDPFRGYYWENRPWRKDARKPSWGYTKMTRQREENEHYEPRQLDYSTGLEMVEAVRKKR